MITITSRTLVAVLGAFALVASPLLPTHQDAAPEHAAIAAEARVFATHYIETLEGKNEDAIRTLFVADERFAWYTDGALSYADADDVIAGMRAYAGITFKTTLADITPVVLDSRRVSLRTRFETTLTIPNADDFTYGGVITWLLEKSEHDNSWRVLLGHTSTPSGPPSGK